MNTLATLPPVPDRRGYIGGSDIAGIMGIAPPGWRTALDIWERKTLPDAAVEETPEAQRKVLARGTIVEPLVATMLKVLYGIEADVRNRRHTSADVPYYAAEIDAELPLSAVEHLFADTGMSAPDHDEIVNVEIKTVHPFRISDWGKDGSDEVPIHYAAQVQWGLGVTGRRLALVAALFGADDLRLYPVVRDDEIIAAMRAKAHEFWRCVVAREAPAPQTLEDVQRLWPTAAMRAAEATPEVAAHLTTLRALKEQEKAIPGVQMLVREFMRDADTLTYEGEVLATLKNRKTGSIDADKLKSEFPDAYRACKREGTTRALLLKD